MASSCLFVPAAEPMARVVASSSTPCSPTEAILLPFLFLMFMFKAFLFLSYKFLRLFLFRIRALD